MQSESEVKGGFFAVPSGLDNPGAPELCESLVQGEGKFRVERIVSMGHVSPEGFWYDQEEDEWCLVTEGEGRIAFDDGSVIRLCTGQSVLIPAHRRHRVVYTSSPCIWLCVFGSGPGIGHTA